MWQLQGELVNRLPNAQAGIEEPGKLSQLCPKGPYMSSLCFCILGVDHPRVAFQPLANQVIYEPEP